MDFKDLSRINKVRQKIVSKSLKFASNVGKAKKGVCCLEILRFPDIITGGNFLLLENFPYLLGKSLMPILPTSRSFTKKLEYPSW